MLTVPDLQASPTFDGQSCEDSTDDQARQLGDTFTGVVSGGAITPHTGSDMNVSMAAVVVAVAGVVTSAAAVTSTAIAAASATDRRDIVIYTPGTGIETSGSGTTHSAACTGVACGTAGWSRSSTGLPPVKPAIPSGSVLLGEVYVANTTTVIATGNIIDKTYIIPNPLNYTASASTTQAISGASATAITSLTTATLQPGTYELAATVTLLNGATAGSVDAWAQMVSGTATGLPSLNKYFVASIRDCIVLTGTFTVTAAGAVEIMIQSAASQTMTVENNTANASKANATSVSVNAN